METLSDIVAEMRRNGDAWCEDKSTNKTECLGLITLKYAARIEAAWRREKAEAEADALVVGGIVEEERHKPGNAAAMREALEHIGIIAEAMYSDSGDCNSVNANTVSILNLVRAALAAPARQCDVGTATEQAERFVKHCQSFLNRDGIKACAGCPCCGVVMYGKCELAWAQTPYAAEEGGAA